MKATWFSSIRVQLGIAVLTVFIVLVGTLGYSLQELRLRQHDYLILNLTGKLRVLSQAMTEQARVYAEQAPDDYDKYNRDLATYWQGLQKQIALYDQIILALESRQIDADLVGATEHKAIYCTWDDQSRMQMGRSAEDWKVFKAGLDAKLGSDLNVPRLTWAAEYMAQHGDALIASSDRLSKAFQTMMEAKLNNIRYFQMAAAVAGVLIIMLILYGLQRLIINPLHQTVHGFDRVARGDFGYQVPVLVENEIGQMTYAFNRLTERLNSMFRLTDRISQGKKLDEMLRFVHEEFQGFVPVDWVGIFYSAPDGNYLSLERGFGSEEKLIKDGATFDMRSGALLTVSQQHSPVALPLSSGNGDLLEHQLLQSGLQAAVYLPLLKQGESFAAMVFASSDKDAYQATHIEFLANVASTMAHILDKTIVMERLVTSAVQGLAKLAESRDPETGDHLVRMALYSALLAEELGRDGPYVDLVTPAYVRDVYYFAPMHDIGKVGIRDDVLLKPGRLDPDERKEMERHPVIGAQALRQCEAQMTVLGHSMFQIGIEIAECHHEKFDGSGYPAGLVGQDIPLSARIVAVADVFDALTSKRPYKEAWTVEKTITVMQEDAGKHFDPAVIAAMTRTLPRFMEIYERLKHV